MKKFYFFAIFLLQLLLTGCAATAHLTENLKPASAEKSLNRVVIYEDKTYRVLRGPLDHPWIEGLSRGVYKPELENEFGTFYRGPEGCVTQIGGDVSLGPFDGGVWIPRDKVNERAQIYYYFNHNEIRTAKTGGLILSMILESYKNDIFFVVPVVDKTFIDDLRITNF